MNQRVERLNLFFVPAVMLACTLSQAPNVTPSAAPGLVEMDELVATDEALDPEDARTPWRWIGTKGDDGKPGCPVALGWSAERLFAQDDDSTVPKGLRGFCLYEQDGGSPSQLHQLVAQGRLSGVAPDHMGVGTSANELKAAVWKDLRAQFLDLAGHVDLPVGVGVPPRLAFADTGPTNEVDPENGWTDNSLHGYSLANLAKDLLCDAAGDCLAWVTSRLALPHTDLSPNRHPLRGGYIGTLSELAVAVRREVYAWETSGVAHPLILNLSLGWDGGLFGGGEPTVGAMPLDVQAVYRALEDAVCRGAVVVAAAGNAGGGPDPETGPLHPAAWEGRSAPSFSDCQGALQGSGAPDPGLWPAKYWPMVYAAGGLTAGGDALATARPGGEPRLAAFADHAVADDSRFHPTEVLTGSSVSAMVVSAAAAAVWHYRPGLAGHEVMELVYQGGDDLGRDADFCLGGFQGNPCPRTGLAVRQTSVCAAVSEACAGGAAACPGTVPQCVTGANLDLSTADLDTYLATPPIEVDLSDATFTLQDPACGGETLHYAVPPADPCPHRQYYGQSVDLWNGTQPGTDPCSSCWMNPNTGSGLAAGGPTDLAASGTIRLAAGGTIRLATDGKTTLYIEIDPDFGGTLTSATLILGSDAYSLDPAAILVAGDRVLVKDVPARVGGATPALLAFTLNGDRSVVSPLLVVDN